MKYEKTHVDEAIDSHVRNVIYTLAARMFNSWKHPLPPSGVGFIWGDEDFVKLDEEEREKWLAAAKYALAFKDHISFD